MKKTLLTLGCILCLLSCKNETPLKNIIEDGLQFSALQYSNMAEAIKADSLCIPRTTEPDGKLKSVQSNDWTSGFYPGILWYLFESTKDSIWKERAIAKTALIEKEKTNIYTHDLGFMIYDCFGIGYRLTGDTNYAKIMVQGAYSLCKRYNPKVGLIRSWDHGKWQYPVIIDNMMNLEFILWAFKHSGDSSFYKIAITHADNTMKNHFRKDFSTWHVVSYDTITGAVVEKVTCQGYADSSAWARGQAWGLYGYTVMYRETHDTKYLDLAKNIANYIINHPNLAQDKVPYWDYNAPDKPNAKRDASAAAITCSALLELSDYVDSTLSNQYMVRAEELIRSLSSPQFRAKLNENNNFILMHSVGSHPHNSEVDVPLNYADYYYIESLLRFKNKIQ